MMDCLRSLDQYELLKYSHKRSYRFVNDQNLLELPYMELIKAVEQIELNKNVGCLVRSFRKKT